ncbi:MAG: hypothetical protein AVDCRST_MAG93-4481, partial [uncultured Chloroflexia bacterium]
FLQVSRPDDGKRALISGIYVGEGYQSDHKADEWSARRRVLQYRIMEGKVLENDFASTIFIYDGNWSSASLTQLQRAGWAHICQLPDIENALQEAFS